MGLRDQNVIMSDSQDLTGAGTGATLCSKSIDLWGGASSGGLITDTTLQTDVNGNSPAHDPGLADMGLDVRVDAAVTSAGAATVQAQVITADDQALTTNVTIIQQTDAIAKATLVAGYRFKLGRLPPGMSQRFLGVQYNVGTAALTAGKVSASLVATPQ